jgi:virginiamycin B lyase
MRRLWCAAFVVLCAPTFTITPRASAAGAGADPWPTVAHATTFTGPAIDSPTSITVGPDGALWFTDRDAIGRITTDGQVRRFVLPSNLHPAPSIAAGPDGALWFFATPGSDGKIVRLTTTGGVTTFPAPLFPHDIVAGPDALYFAFGAICVSFGCQGDQIERMTTDGSSNVISDPGGIVGNLALAPDAALWFSQSSLDIGDGLPGTASVGRVTTDGNTSNFPLDRSLTVGSVALAPDGSMWTNFAPRTHPVGTVVARVSASGLESDVATATTPSDELVIGPDDAMWARSLPAIGTDLLRVTADGTTATVEVPQGGFAPHIVLGPDGNFWGTYAGRPGDPACGGCGSDPGAIVRIEVLRPPATPTDVGWTFSGATATATFEPPVDAGGAVHLEYVATCRSDDGASTRTATTAASPLVVTGLTAGTTWSCSLESRNARYPAFASAPSEAVAASPATPITTPNAAAALAVPARPSFTG